MGFYILLGDYIAEYSSPYMSAFTLFRGLVGDFDFSIFFNVEDVNIRLLGCAAFSVYLAVALIVMFNILIGTSSLKH